MICLLASFLTSRSALFNIVQNMSFVRWYAMCLCEEMTKNKLVDEIYSSKNAEFNLYSSWDAEPFFSFVWFKMRKGTRKQIFKKRDKPTPWQTIHDLGLFVVSNANATMFWYWTVCGRILQVRLNFPRDDRGTKDKGEEDWGRSGIGKVFPAGIGKKPNPWDHYGRANGAREQIYLFAESAN